MIKNSKASVLIAAAFALPASAFAQGQDGTRAERSLQVMTTLLPGMYDSVNQSYFDRRLKVSDAAAHERKALKITPLSSGDETFVFELIEMTGEDFATEGRQARLEFDVSDHPERFVSRAYLPDKSEAVPTYIEGCDIEWVLEAGQYQGSQGAHCSDEGYLLSGAKELFLSETALWVDYAGDTKSHYDLERARSFSCYVDVPGVGGGRDVPYKRYEIEEIHDKGGAAWVDLDDGSRVSVRLQNIRWPMNNEDGIFTRHSFVMYIGRMVDGDEEEVSYTWTIPQAPRIGMNLKWMLANCYMISNRDVEPYFITEPMVDLAR